jgi:hypothetical protein
MESYSECVFGSKDKGVKIELGLAIYIMNKEN